MTVVALVMPRPLPLVCVCVAMEWREPQNSDHGLRAVDRSTRRPSFVLQRARVSVEITGCGCLIMCCCCFSAPHPHLDPLIPQPRHCGLDQEEDRAPRCHPG